MLETTVLKWILHIMEPLMHKTCFRIAADSHSEPLSSLLCLVYLQLAKACTTLLTFCSLAHRISSPALSAETVFEFLSAERLKVLPSRAFSRASQNFFFFFLTDAESDWHCLLYFSVTTSSSLYRCQLEEEEEEEERGLLPWKPRRWCGESRRSSRPRCLTACNCLPTSRRGPSRPGANTSPRHQRWELGRELMGVSQRSLKWSLLSAICILNMTTSRLTSHWFCCWSLSRGRVLPVSSICFYPLERSNYFPYFSAVHLFWEITDRNGSKISIPDFLKIYRTHGLGLSITVSLPESVHL